MSSGFPGAGGLRIGWEGSGGLSGGGEEAVKVMLISVGGGEWIGRREWGVGGQRRGGKSNVNWLVRLRGGSGRLVIACEKRCWQALGGGGWMPEGGG